VDFAGVEGFEEGNEVGDVHLGFSLVVTRREICCSCAILIGPKLHGVVAVVVAAVVDLLILLRLVVVVVRDRRKPSVSGTLHVVDVNDINVVVVRRVFVGLENCKSRPSSQSCSRRSRTGPHVHAPKPLQARPRSSRRRALLKRTSARSVRARFERLKALSSSSRPSRPSYAENSAPSTSPST
jgi:hypothetical protein